MLRAQGVVIEPLLRPHLTSEFPFGLN